MRQEHLGPGGHEGTVDQLGAWARGGLSAGRRATLEAHLAGCPACRVLAAELTDVDATLRSG